MKTQWNPQVKYRSYNAGQWSNCPGHKICKTFEEAERAIDKEIKNGKPHIITVYRDGKYCQEMFTDLEVIETRIRRREVTDWEVAGEEDE